MARLNHKGEYWSSLDKVEVLRDVANTRVAGTLVSAVTVGSVAYELDGVSGLLAVNDFVRINQRDLLEIQQITTVAGQVLATSTLTATLNFLNNETVEIGGQTYTFKTSLTVPAVPGEVLLGGSQGASVDNLRDAINNGATEGTDYATGTLENLDVSAVNNADNLDVTCKYIGVAGNAVTTTETAATASWTGGTLTGGVNATGNMRFPFAYAHAAAVQAQTQTAFDLGHIGDDGANITFSGDHNPVQAATKRLVTAYLTGHAEIMAEFSLLGFAEENWATAVGQPETDVAGSGTTAAPTTLAITADDFNTENDLSWRLTGARKDGKIVFVDLWGCEVDFTAIANALQRGSTAPVPVRAKTTSGLRLSHF